MAFHRSMR